MTHTPLLSAIANEACLIRAPDRRSPWRGASASLVALAVTVGLVGCSKTPASDEEPVGVPAAPNQT
ncbi:MAG TPA: hypothetical protein VNW92_31770, partial [Polyangiaceae bacterium]|nr:hypothetical protein [Polyangiaceae bacterium]